MIRLLLALAVLSSALVAAATALYVMRREPDREYAARWDEGDDGWGVGV